MANPKLKDRKLKKKARKVALRVLGRARERRRDVRGLLAICNRCGKKRDEVRKFTDWVEREIADDPALRDQVAVRRVGCLGPCPGKKLTVALGGTRDRDWKRCYVLDPKRDKGALMGLLCQRIAV